MDKNRRSIWNYMKAAKLSRSYHFHVLMMGIVLSSVLLAFGAQQLNEANMAAAALPESSLSLILQEKVTYLAGLFFAVFMTFVLCTAIYVFVFSQRVGGPIIFLCQYIDELKRGNYGKPRHLRKGDELGAILEKLNELADTLAERSNKRS